MLQTDDPRATIQTLLAERNPLYREVSDLIVETTGLAHGEVADHVLTELTKWYEERD